MPKVSRDTASQSVSLDGHEIRTEHMEGGYSVCFESHTADMDVADWFRGLPGDRCPVPRWGYVLAGMITFRLPEGEETYVAGDAYFVPPGHTPVHYAGAEIVEFSPTGPLLETIGVVMANVQGAGAAS